MSTSRREFLVGTVAATSALVIGVTLPLTRGLARAENAVSNFSPNAFLRIASDGRVTVICGLSEMGQGVHTGIATLVAEELDVDWTTVQVEQAPVDAVYANPATGMQMTAGSASIRGNYLPMRKAGAAARSMLVDAAAAQWSIDRETCRTEHGRVIAPDGRSLAYGQLVAAAARLTVPNDPQLKDPRNFRLLGRRLQRIDTAAKVDGSAIFGIDVKLPGLLTAVMAHPPVPRAKIVSFDATATKAIPGVRDVVQIPFGVAVIADGFWPAVKGRDALIVKWDEGDLGTLSSAAISKQLADAVQMPGTVARADTGTHGTSDSASRMVDAQYEVPFLAHGCMEPMNCTAWVRNGGLELWAPTQGPGLQQGILAGVLGLPPDKIRINTTYLGGGFGRRTAPDFVIAAALIAKAVGGAPVKLIYTRDDDMRGGFYRPASVARFQAGLNARGEPVSVSVRIAAPSLMLAARIVQELPDGIDEPAVEGFRECPYDFPGMKVEYAQVEPGVQIWFWRAVGHSQNGYFLEAFVDELAAAAGKDPVDFRRSLLGRQPRLRAVLDLAAQKARWGSPLPAGRYRGIAVTSGFGSFAAQVAEISLAGNVHPRVHRIVAAVDCGVTVNPEIVARQVESAIVYGLSAALHGRITFKNGRVEQSNFVDYPILSIDQTPQVEVHIVPSTEAPGGVGELGLPAVAPAVANALYAATGKRVRRLPLVIGAA